MKMKKILTSVVLFAAGLFAANAQQLQTGDTFTYTNADGVVKTYTVTGEHLIENPSFEANTEGWLGGGGGTLTGVDWQSTGGVDGGAYLRLTENAGKGIFLNLLCIDFVFIILRKKILNYHFSVSLM